VRAAKDLVARLGGDEFAIPDGAACVYAADNAYAEMGSAGPSFRTRR